MSNIFEMVKFNSDGLIPAVTQDIRTDEVLMLAYMNKKSLMKTIETGKVHYFSRSRQKLWLKGETSGHFQQVRSISIDCDGDTLLLKVEQTGAACHTGHRSCFFTRMEADELKAGVEQEGQVCDQAPTASIHMSTTTTADDVDASTFNTADTDVANTVDASNAADVTDSANTANAVNTIGTTEPAGAEILKKVFDVISDRQVHPKEGSYTNYLFSKGIDKILKKIGEEACEVVIASKNGTSGEIKAEIADLIYHVMVLLAERGMTLQDVYEELKQRE